MPQTMIVSVNCRSTRGPCSEMASGNHQCLLTNMPTEPSVMIQMAIPRARPIDYLPLKRLRAKSEVRIAFTLSALPFALCRSPIQDHHSEQQRQVQHGS